MVDRQQTRIDRPVFLAGIGPVGIVEDGGVEGERLLDLILVVPVPLVARGLDRELGLLGGRVLRRQKLEGGNPRNSSTMTGPTVQITSISVLWLVREGTGLALARNLTMQ